MFNLIQSLFNTCLSIFCITFLLYCRSRFDELKIILRGIQFTNKLRDFDNREVVDIPDFVKTYRNSEKEYLFDERRKNV